jgi:hypothetical protein
MPPGRNTIIITSTVPNASMRYSDKNLAGIREQNQNKGPHNNPHNRSHATQYHHTQDVDGFPDGEAGRVDKGGFGGKDHTGETGPGGAQGKSHELGFGLSMPMAWQATSSSRRAIQALPILESCSRLTTKMVARLMAIIRK